VWGSIMVFNKTFNFISVISWRSVLLVEENGYPEKTTDLLQVTDIMDKEKCSRCLSEANVATVLCLPH